ncbi:MAG: hypothetical protein ACLR5S_12050 [Ruminococcus sp.]
MFQKLLAGITAAALCCTMPGLYWAASAEEQQPTVKTIQLDKATGSPAQAAQSPSRKARSQAGSAYRCRTIRCISR